VFAPRSNWQSGLQKLKAALILLKKPGKLLKFSPHQTICANTAFKVLGDRDI
jgi:hypothetical protein